jgi:hypothetical protein
MVKNESDNEIETKMGKEEKEERRKIAHKLCSITTKLKLVCDEIRSPVIAMTARVERGGQGDEIGFHSFL